MLAHTAKGHELSTGQMAVNARAHGSDNLSPKMAPEWSRTTRVFAILPGCNKCPSTTYRWSPASCPGGFSTIPPWVRRMQLASRTGRRHKRQSAAVSRLLGSLRSDAERMAAWTARSSPVRARGRAAELAGRRVQLGGSSKRHDVAVKAVQDRSRTCSHWKWPQSHRGRPR